MNRIRVLTQVFLYFLMMMFLMVVVGCSSSSDNKPPATTAYTVTFDSQSADVAANPTSIAVTPPTTTVGVLPSVPTKAGYTFVGWFTNTGGAGTEFTATTPVTASITVYAFWTANTNPVYTVTFDSQGGTPVGPQHAVSGGTVTLPAAPTKTGYLFNNWNIKVDGTGAQFTASTTVTGDITVYAQWSSYDYVVTYNSQGGTSVTSQDVISPATTVGTLPADPTKTNYNFAGWNTQADGSGTAFTATTTVTADITVYAQWTQSTVYTVTFNAEGGSSVAPQQVVSGGTVGTLPTTTRTSYTFGGWYTDTSYTTAFTASTTVTASITVYAKWTAVTGSYTATATYTWNSGTTTLVIIWTGSNFICNGPPSSGSETETGVTITTTTMTWPNSNDGLGMTWTRSSAGTASDPSGTWTSNADQDGNTFTVVVVATNSTSGSMTVSGNVTACGSRDYNPAVQTNYQPGNGTGTYALDLWYDEYPKTASSVTVIGTPANAGIPTSLALTYDTTNESWGNYVQLGATLPSPTGFPWTYTFTIDSTTKNVSVSCFMTTLVTNLAPTGTIATLTPTFSWTGIGASDAIYSVEVFNSGGSNQIWKKKTKGTSVLYDGTALSSGTAYSFRVEVYSYSTCKDGVSAVSTNFTTP
ncbi:MAG: InlB B-repeat-containing protein [Smithella sp.]|jgi:uncharacterized repeat protein (TIGR02543 family)